MYALSLCGVKKRLRGVELLPGLAEMSRRLPATLEVATGDFLDGSLLWWEGAGGGEERKEEANATALKRRVYWISMSVFGMFRTVTSLLRTPTVFSNAVNHALPCLLASLVEGDVPFVVFCHCTVVFERHELRALARLFSRAPSGSRFVAVGNALPGLPVSSEVLVETSWGVDVCYVQAQAGEGNGRWEEEGRG